MPRIWIDEVNSIETTADYDEMADRLIVKRVQDVEPILERNKRLQADHDGFTPSRNMKWVGSIPNIIIEKWMRELGIDVFNKDHRPAVARLLNDPEWRWLRTSPGRVG